MAGTDKDSVCVAFTYLSVRTASYMHMYIYIYVDIYIDKYINIYIYTYTYTTDPPQGPKPSFWFTCGLANRLNRSKKVTV